MATPKKAEKTSLAAQQLVVCPRCAGNKRILDFRGGDRLTGELAGWKAVDCPGCQGMGSVDAKKAAAILAAMENGAG